jgi:translation initiation factor 6
MCVGNSKGLLVPSIIFSDEMERLRELLPESIEIGKLEDSLSAIGNCISTNDSVALIHPEYSKENEEIISRVLGVEVFKTTIANNPLVATYSQMNNKGCAVHPSTSIQEYEELSTLL